MEATNSPDFEPSLESLSFRYDEDLVSQLVASAKIPMNIDDDFDLSQFDWILRRSVALGVQDHTHFYRTPLRQIGEGGNFKVYTCNTQLSLESDAVEEQVALKRLKVEVYVGRTKTSIREQDALKSLLREIYTMSAFSQHPNILTIYGFGSEFLGLEDLTAPDLFSYRPFLVVVYAPLGTLVDFLRSDQVPVTVRIGLCVDVGNAVRALHQHGYIHRDVKPQNVLVFQEDQGSVLAKLADFGMTLFHGGDAGAQFNITQYFGGTERYAAPELVNRRTIDLTIQDMRKGDVFSFGVTFFECISCLEYGPELSLFLSEPTALVKLLQPAMESATDSERLAVSTLVERTICKSTMRASNIDEVLYTFENRSAHTTLADPAVSVSESEGIHWPQADSITENVFSQSSWMFLGGDEELTVSTSKIRISSQD